VSERSGAASSRGSAATWLVAAPVLAILVWTVVWPNVSVIVGSFDGGLQHWRAFFANPSDRDALRNTIVVAVASVVAATAIGLPLAFLLTHGLMAAIVAFVFRRQLSVHSLLRSVGRPGSRK